MKPSRILYFALALTGAICLYGGLKLHRHVTVEGTSESEQLTVGLAGSPLFTRTTASAPAEGEPTGGEPPPVANAWHPVSGSAALAVVGLGLLVAAGALRKSMA